METEAVSDTRSPLAKAIGALFEVKLGETIEHGFIKSVGSLQRILVLFVFMGIFAGATCIALSLLILSTTYLITNSLYATAIAGAVTGAFIIVLTLLFFRKVLSQSFWFGIFKITLPPEP